MAKESKESMWMPHQMKTNNKENIFFQKNENLELKISITEIGINLN